MSQRVSDAGKLKVKISKQLEIRILNFFKIKDFHDFFVFCNFDGFFAKYLIQNLSRHPVGSDDTIEMPKANVTLV